jgi:hypothetical protein
VQTAFSSPERMQRGGGEWSCKFTRCRSKALGWYQSVAWAVGSCNDEHRAWLMALNVGRTFTAMREMQCNVGSEFHENEGARYAGAWETEDYEERLAVELVLASERTPLRTLGTPPQARAKGVGDSRLRRRP